MYAFGQYGTKQLRNLVVRVRSLWNGCECLRLLTVSLSRWSASRSELLERTCLLVLVLSNKCWMQVACLSVCQCLCLCLCVSSLLLRRRRRRWHSVKLVATARTSAMSTQQNRQWNEASSPAGHTGQCHSLVTVVSGQHDHVITSIVKLLTSVVVVVVVVSSSRRVSYMARRRRVHRTRMLRILPVTDVHCSATVTLPPHTHGVETTSAKVLFTLAVFSQIMCAFFTKLVKSLSPCLCQTCLRCGYGLHLQGGTENTALRLLACCKRLAVD